MRTRRFYLQWQNDDTRTNTPASNQNIVLDNINRDIEEDRITNGIEDDMGESGNTDDLRNLGQDVQPVELPNAEIMERVQRCVERIEEGEVIYYYPVCF